MREDTMRNPESLYGPYLIFGDFCWRLRISRAFTLREFCKTAGLDPTKVSRLERGFGPLREYLAYLDGLAAVCNLAPRKHKTI
jgi:transcriptional regulator with XRE-family HTH domain